MLWGAHTMSRRNAAVSGAPPPALPPAPALADTLSRPSLLPTRGPAGLAVGETVILLALSLHHY